MNTTPDPDLGKRVLLSAILSQRDDLERALIFVRNYLSDGRRQSLSPYTDRKVIEKIDATLVDVFGEASDPSQHGRKVDPIY